MLKSIICCTALASSACVLAAPAPAAEFPTRPIVMYVPFPVGSGSDSTARVVAKEMTQATGQPVVVENKPGAHGFIATRQVAAAPADGYTILLTSNTHYANKFLYKDTPYDPISDFEVVAVVREPSPLILAVGADSPYKTLEDITRAAREAPGKLSFASGNSSSQVAGELYQQLTGTDLLYVPYKGNAEGLTEVAAGRVDMIFSDVGALRPIFQAGKVRPVVVTGEQKLGFLKGVPTASEAGLPQLNIGSWGVFLAPKGTPDAVLERLNQMIGATTQTESMKGLTQSLDGVHSRLSRPQIDAFVKTEMKKWGQIIQNAGIELK